MTSKAAEPRKKLIEHSIPLGDMNAASEVEKQIKVAKHTSIHQWFAPRPLSTNRAIIFSQLVDDPSAWPTRFPSREDQDVERQRLHQVIREMVEWPKSSAQDLARFERAIQNARWEIARSVAWGLGEEPPSSTEPGAVVEYLQSKAPAVCDPFCGGGSIPLEAQRLGLRTYGSDLNPIAVLITKALAEIPPKFAGLGPVSGKPTSGSELLRADWRAAAGLAADVRHYAEWMRDMAESKIGQLYPKANFPGDGAVPVVAWLWARTIASPDPALRGAHVPLASTFVLSGKKGKEAIAEFHPDETAKDGWRFVVKTSHLTKNEMAQAKGGTKAPSGADHVCIRSGARISAEYIKAEGKAGRLKTRLMAVFVEASAGRDYVSPGDDQESAASLSAPDAPDLQQSTPEFLTGGTSFAYGLDRFDRLFTARQLTALLTFSDLIPAVHAKICEDAENCATLRERPNPGLPLSEGGTGPRAYADAVVTYLAMCLNRLAQCQTSLNRWFDGRKLQPVFDRQAMQMVTDFAEGNPFGTSTGSWSAAVKYPMVALERWGGELPAQVDLIDAAKNSFPCRNAVFVTDPPYYNNIAYADLSDFFYVWLRRSLRTFHPDLFRRVLSPKSEELVANPHRHGSKAAAEEHFISGMRDALVAMRNASADSPLTIYYAFKQSELKKEGVVSAGWAAFLSAVVDAGLQVDGTWPVRTEHSSRSISQGANALASSVVLVCRKRPSDAPVIGRREFLRELGLTIGQSISDHQKANIPLPDRRQAAIGPGIGVFSKYSMVREADDSAMRVSTALALINKEIDSALGTGTEEMDAETRFALQWFEQHGYRQIEGGAGGAISQLQGFNLSEARINASGVFRAKGGNAKLLTREEMHEAAQAKHRSPWRPSIDDNLTVWELAQHMARSLLASDGGIDAAGRLLAEARVHASDVQLVAERLYELTSTRQAEEARVWSQLQGSWVEIEAAADRAAEEGIGAVSEQADMFEDE